MREFRQTLGTILIWALAWGVIILCVVKCNAQCPEADVCENALELNLCGMNPGDVVCYPDTLCNGYFLDVASGITVPYCDDENGGDPQGCSSSTSVEHDFWIRLQVCEDWVYSIRFDSDYFNYNFDQIDGGAQMWIYDNCSELNMLETAVCDQVQEQDIMMDVYLESGEYLVQIDGYGASVGCGVLCVYRHGFLNVGVTENVQFLQKYTGQMYNVLGQRTR